jgi:hypothetical protein
MNHRRLAVAALCALIPIAGCARLGALEDDRASAKATWEAHRPEHYEFTVGVYCFCPMIETGVTFRVANGVAQFRTEVAERELTTYEDFRTIDEIFEFIRERISTRPFKMDVVYNPEFGYPVSVGIDRRYRVADDELGVRVWGFKVLPAPGGGVPEP